MAIQNTKRAPKPLHKSVIFWIVAVAVLAGVNLVQYRFGLPWVRERIAAAQPASRVAPPEPPPRQFSFANGQGGQQQPGLDYSKKTYPWQKPRPSGEVLEATTPQVIIVPSEFKAPSGGWSMSIGNGAVGVRVPAGSIVRTAYNSGGAGGVNRNRIILPPDLPTGDFDFIARQPSGAMEALQEAIRKKWGLVGNPETRVTNVLILTVDHSGAPGLKPVSLLSIPQTQQGQNMNIVFQNAPFSAVTSYLEAVLQRPILDQTGLTGNYYIELPQMNRFYLPAAAGRQPDITPDELDWLKKIFMDQLGLQVTESTASIDYTVVTKAGHE